MFIVVTLLGNVSSMTKVITNQREKYINWIMKIKHIYASKNENAIHQIGKISVNIHPIIN